MTPQFRHAAAPAALDQLGFGLPEDRLARIAARRAFVELKTSFMRAALHAAGPGGERLRRRVREADEAVQLWRLRSALLAALPAGQVHCEPHRRELLLQLDSVFPDSGPETCFVPL